MLLVGVPTKYRQVPKGAVITRACTVCATETQWIECYKKTSLEIWFVDVLDHTEHVMVCTLCHEDVAYTAAMAGAHVVVPTAPPPPATRPAGPSVDERLAALKAKMAADVPITTARIGSVSGTVLLYDRTALGCAPSELRDGDTCRREAERGNLCFAWHGRPPVDFALQLRVGLEIPESMRGRSPVAGRELFLRAPDGLLRWAALEEPEAGPTLSVPAGNYLVDTWLGVAIANRAWWSFSRRTELVTSLRLRRTDQKTGRGGGIP